MEPPVSPHQFDALGSFVSAADEKVPNIAAYGPSRPPASPRAPRRRHLDADSAGSVSSAASQPGRAMTGSSTACRFASGRAKRPLVSFVARQRDRRATQIALRARAPALAPTRRAAATTQVGAPDAPPPLSGPQAAPHTQPFGPAGETSHTVDPGARGRRRCPARPTDDQTVKAGRCGRRVASQESVHWTRAQRVRVAHPHTPRLCIPRACVYPRTPASSARLAAPSAAPPTPRRHTREQCRASSFHTAHCGRESEWAQGVRAREPCGPSSLRAPFLHRVVWAQRRRVSRGAVRAWCGSRVVLAHVAPRSAPGAGCSLPGHGAAGSGLATERPASRCSLRSAATPPFKQLAHTCMQNFAAESTSQLQGWPSGLRRCVQVAVFS